MTRPEWTLRPVNLPAALRPARPGPREALAALAGAGMLAGALVGTPSRGVLVLGLTGGLALLAALLLRQRWCSTVAAGAALIGTAVLAGLRPASASTGRIAGEVLLLTAYLVLADAVETRAPPRAAVRQLPAALASMAVALLVLAALGLPPAPYAWLALLGLVAALTVFGVVAGGRGRGRRDGTRRPGAVDPCGVGAGRRRPGDGVFPGTPSQSAYHRSIARPGPGGPGTRCGVGAGTGPDQEMGSAAPGPASRTRNAVAGSRSVPLGISLAGAGALASTSDSGSRPGVGRLNFVIAKRKTT